MRDYFLVTDGESFALKRVTRRRWLPDIHEVWAHSMWFNSNFDCSETMFWRSHEEASGLLREREKTEAIIRKRKKALKERP